MAAGPTESETCRELILPALRAAGWADDQIIEEYPITDGRIIPMGQRHRRDRPLRADYVLEVDGVPVTLVEAKRTRRSTADGVTQAKQYGRLLELPAVYASNGRETRSIDLVEGREEYNASFPSPEEAWARFEAANGLTPSTSRAFTEPFNRTLRLFDGRAKTPRYYQRIAINRAVSGVLAGKRRQLLVMATGTGKSFVAMQIVWKLQRAGLVEGRKPRVLYLADRNLLIDQPMLREFVPVFQESSIHKLSGEVKTGRDIYFGLYQNLDSGDGWYREYPADYFDVIIVDECHRGSSNADSAWRQILEHFEPAAQIGLTATPVGDETDGTYRHFGNPIYEYSLARGIDDGFLAPYSVRRVVLSADAFGFAPTPEQIDLFGQKIPERLYETQQFERVVALLSRTETAAQHLTDLLRATDPYGKTIVFCVNSEHADDMRRHLANLTPDLATEGEDWVVRIVSAESRAKVLLGQFEDPERALPAVATTSQLLSTGVDIPSVRNVVLFRPIGSMALFKQIIGRGTRIDVPSGKYQFEIIDYCGATRLFHDEDFDGPPVADTEEEIDGEGQVVGGGDDTPQPEPPHVPIAERPAAAEPEELDADPEVTKFYVDDEPVWVVSEGVYVLDPSTQRPRLVEYRSYLADVVRSLAETPNDLRGRWMAAPDRQAVLDALEARGLSIDDIVRQTGIADADPLDLLVHLAWNEPLASRHERARRVRAEQRAFFEQFAPEARAVLDELLDKYAAFGLDEVSTASLQVPPLSELGSPVELARRFGGADQLRSAISELADRLYAA